jgi:pimeloyl-ACP methyl ester carboxylesterase
MKLRWKILLGIVLAIGLAFGYLMYDKQDRMHRVTPEALAALESDDLVTVTQNEWFVFEPASSTPSKGLIFYPGGECDERGYAEPLREIAAAGYLVVLVPMPMQLAVLAPDKATDVIAAYPDIDSWTIAGHSLGGSMAARYAFHHPDHLAGLVMWDAYAPDDMTDRTLAVRMVHRANQAGDPPADYEPYLPFLPPQTDFFPLKGGIHLNFGNFIAGRLYRDEPTPALDPITQRELAAAATIEFMHKL